MRTKVIAVIVGMFLSAPAPGISRQTTGATTPPQASTLLAKDTVDARSAFIINKAESSAPIADNSFKHLIHKILHNKLFLEKLKGPRQVIAGPRFASEVH